MKSLKEYMLKEDSVDAMKHDKFNDIFQALEKLNSEYDELDSLDRDENSTGVGDLTDQLTTMRKHIQGLYMVLDRMDKVVPKESTEEVKEAVSQELMDQVIMQIKQDCDMGDYTAIEELIKDIPEQNMRGFLSDYGGNPLESNELSTLKRLAGIEEDVDQQYKDVMATKNQIKINRFLAKQPEDVAKRLTGNKAQTSKIVGKKIMPSTSEYSHSRNPEFFKAGI